MSKYQISMFKKDLRILLINANKRHLSKLIKLSKMPGDNSDYRLTFWSAIESNRIDTEITFCVSEFATVINAFLSRHEETPKRKYYRTKGASPTNERINRYEL